METVESQLRSDAQENRDRIVEAARALFAERGLSVGVKEIAYEAHVSRTTLHRRFPLRETLIEEAFAAELHACRRIVLDGSIGTDAGIALAGTVRRLIALSTRNRNFVDSLQEAGHLPSGVTEHRRQLLEMLDLMVGRARSEGSVRPDLTVDDIVLILRAGRSLPAGPRAGDRSAERFADLVLGAL